MEKPRPARPWVMGLDVAVGTWSVGVELAFLRLVFPVFQEAGDTLPRIGFLGAQDELFRAPMLAMVVMF